MLTRSNYLKCFIELVQKSNPLLEEEAKTGKPGVMKKQHSMFKERLRAEQESFKAVFDRRRHRIGGLDADDD